ncbi:MAG: hypothetical protein JST59_01490 [Actinobacteria bacterium]|nr:hypothetical protein [Actinomycetota bacterium]
MSEVEFKLNAIAHQNQDLQIENERLKGELQRMQDIYSNKIHALETQLTIDGKSLEDTTSFYAKELEKFKREGQEYVETLTFEYERKVKNLEERLKVAENSRKDLGMDNKRLNDLLNNNKMSYEQELRDTISRVRDEENKKYVFLSKSSEQKLKMSQDAQDALNKKNLNLLKVIQERERQMQELENGQNVEKAKLLQDIADLNSKNNQLNFMLDKLRNDLNAKNAMIDRSVGESGQEAVYLKQQLDSKKQEVEVLNQTIAQMEQRLMHANAEGERRKLEQLERQRLLELECLKYKCNSGLT